MPNKPVLKTNGHDEWWKKAVFYQIYPRSYQDTTGNGVGDLKGITKRLSYIRDLGVDAIWISPFFKSPQKDYGYDVSDYETVDPLFGTNKDFKTLLEKAHNMGLKIIVDLVLSHTSDQHEWFKESRSSRDNPKADWYVWADPKPDGSPPNNWQSYFGGSAWTYDFRRGQYYLHQFLKEQPDLNFHNHEIRQSVLDVFKFWLDFGVDGFRLDAIIHCFSDPELRDNPVNPKPPINTQFNKPDLYWMQEHLHDRDQPEALDFCKKIRALLNKYPDTMAVGEVGDSVSASAKYCDDKSKLHTAYSFSLTSGDSVNFGSTLFRKHLEESLTFKNFWPSWAFCNHDMIRVTTRWGGKEHAHKPQFAKLLLAILTTLRGTPYIYEGEELGLSDVKIPYEKIQDPWGKFLWPEWQGRDGCRTPMPWNKDKKNAGFSKGSETWLPIPKDHQKNAVDVQVSDKKSVLNFTRGFLKWRKKTPALQTGPISFMDFGEDILVYKRDDILCAFNLRPKPAEISLDLTLDDTNIKSYGCSLKAGKLAFKGFGFGFFNIR